MKRWPLFSIAGISLALIVVRIVWPNLKIDNTSLTLLGIATLALLVAFLPIKRIKWGEFEAELDRALDSVEKKVTAIEMEAAAKPPGTGRASHLSMLTAEGGTKEANEWNKGTQEILSNLFELVKSPASDTEKILAATLLLENTVNRALNLLDPTFRIQRGSPRSGISRMVQIGMLTKAEESAFLEIWNLRNKIVHEGLRPTSEQTARFLEILWRLVRELT